MAATNASNVPAGSFQPDADVQVTFEDQQKINKFARQNARLEDLTDELKVKEKEMQNLEDASDEILLCEDVAIPYLLGEVFVNLGNTEGQTMLDSAKETLKEEIMGLKAQQEAVRQTMSDLKVQLYAKFGNNINLEPDES